MVWIVISATPSFSVAMHTTVVNCGVYNNWNSNIVTEILGSMYTTVLIWRVHSLTSGLEIWMSPDVKLYFEKSVVKFSVCVCGIGIFNNLGTQGADCWKLWILEIWFCMCVCPHAMRAVGWNSWQVRYTTAYLSCMYCQKKSLTGKQCSDDMVESCGKISLRVFYFDLSSS